MQQSFIDFAGQPFKSVSFFWKIKSTPPNLPGAYDGLWSAQALAPFAPLNQCHPKSSCSSQTKTKPVPMDA